MKVGLEKGVFVKLEDGAILSDLKNYNLTDTILQRSDGTSMYFTQDIFLTQLKVNKFKADKYI
jgi:arginyl-tRNA synthetase